MKIKWDKESKSWASPNQAIPISNKIQIPTKTCDKNHKNTAMQDEGNEYCKLTHK